MCGQGTGVWDDVDRAPAPMADQFHPETWPRDERRRSGAGSAGVSESELRHMLETIEEQKHADCPVCKRLREDNENLVSQLPPNSSLVVRIPYEDKCHHSPKSLARRLRAILTAVAAQYEHSKRFDLCDIFLSMAQGVSVH